MERPDPASSPVPWEVLLQCSTDLLTVHDADGTVLFANSASELLLGLAPEAFTGGNPFELVHPEDRDRVIEQMLALRSRPGAVETFEARARHRDGSYRHLQSLARNGLNDPALRCVLLSTRDVTDRALAEQALRNSESRHRDLVECAPIGFVVAGTDTVVRFLNPTAFNLTGRSGLEEVVGHRITDFLRPDERERCVSQMRRALVERERQGPNEYHVVRPDAVPTSLTAESLPYEWDGEPAVLVMLQDVTLLRQAQDERNSAEEGLVRLAAFQSAFLDSLPALTAAVNAAGTMIASNEAWKLRRRERGGWPVTCDVGMSFLAVCDETTGPSRSAAATVAAGLRSLLSGQTWDYQQDVLCELPDSQSVYLSLQMVPLHTPQGGAVIGCTDITRRKLLEVDAAHRATHDVLTGLPNRTLLLERLEHALEQREGPTVAVLLLDLDSFKLVNDGYGHEAGDTVLCELSGRLKHHVRPSDTVARLAGDEFVVLCENLSHATEAYLLADRLIAAMAEPFSLGTTTVTLGASIGIVVATEAVAEPSALLRAADQAMFDAKARGRNRFAVYDTGVRDRSSQRLEQAMTLRRLLEDGDLLVHYQPVVDLRDGHLTGAEALLRWRGDEQLPDTASAIALAEESGLIGRIGHFVLTEATAQAATFLTPDGSMLPVSINLAPQQLDPSLVALVRQVTEEAAYPLTSVTLELTERSVMADPGLAITVLRALRRLGVRIALDDFGVGHSSLASLRDLPLDVLKIDGGFVRGLTGPDADDRLLRAIISMARALDLDVVAEGVEQPDQRDQLLALGCERGQGFLYSPARPAAALRAQSAGSSTGA